MQEPAILTSPPSDGTIDVPVDDLTATVDQLAVVTDIGKSFTAESVTAIVKARLRSAKKAFARELEKLKTEHAEALEEAHAKAVAIGARLAADQLEGDNDVEEE